MPDSIFGFTGLDMLFVVTAMFGGVLVLLRLILASLGHDGDLDFDLDADMDHGHTSALPILSLQGMGAFTLMFGLVGLALSQESEASPFWAVSGGVVAGLFAVWAISRIFFWMLTLQSSGNLKLHSAIGEQGTVYLRIPQNQSGKVQVRIGNRLVERDAVSDDKNAIPSGENVEVVGVNGNMLVVRKI